MNRKIPRGAIRIDLPNVAQTYGYTCGPSALLAICAYYGVGPDEEDQVSADMRCMKDGADPYQIVDAAQLYGFRVKEFRYMSNKQLRRCLDKRRPVLLMLQAWGEKPSYEAEWGDGHWLAAIGYDDDGVYFEDPSLEAARGFLTWDDLRQRWHDVEGAANEHTERYGVAIWKKRKSKYATRARMIE